MMLQVFRRNIDPIQGYISLVSLGYFGCSTHIQLR